MLIRFYVGNYSSYRDRQELSMTSGKTSGHENHQVDVDGVPILRLAAVYGANASGKSNLIKAMRSMRDMVVSDRVIASDRYFRPDPDMRDSPSVFEVEIGLGDRIYSYGFQCILSRREVVDEWLYRLSVDEDNELVFSRIGDRVQHGFSDRAGQRLDLYAEDLVGQRGRLFLNIMGRRARMQDGELSVFNDVFDWFKDRLRFVDSKYPFSPGDLLTDDDFKMLNEVISSFGTGINSIGYDRRDGLDEMIPPELLDRLRRDLGRSVIGVGRRGYASMNDYRVHLEDDAVVFDEIVYRHNGDRVTYRSDEESDGTRKLYGLLTSTFLGMDHCTYVMDELDSGLHPQLTYRFLQLFAEDPAKRGSQLLFTTHESSLMDFQLLRRDEIWFVQKRPEGESELYSLEDFNERNDRKLEKAYREGRYGGIPLFTTVYPPGGRR